MRRTHQAALLLACCLLPLGCSDDGPSGPTADDFSEGACRTLAPSVLTIGSQARKLGDGPTPPADVVQALTDAQGVLRTTMVTVSDDVGDPLMLLVADVGFVRIRAAANTYDPEVGQALLRSYDALVAVCTGAATATPSPG